MTNKERYQKAFSVLKASREIRMEDLEMKKKVNVSKGVAVAATVALCFAGTNGICYAATGDTWVEKVIVYFDGEEVEKDVTVKDLGNGNYGYSLEVDENEESVKMEIVTDEEGNETKKYYSSSNKEAQTSEVTPMLVEEDGKVYLQFGDAKEDITEDYADETASGKMVIEGMEYEYEVTGTVDIYSITLKTCE